MGKIKVKVFMSVEGTLGLIKRLWIKRLMICT